MQGSKQTDDALFAGCAVICAGRAHEASKLWLCDLRSLVLCKGMSVEECLREALGRPIGIGECIRRVALGALVYQERGDWNELLTKPLPGEAKQREAAMAEAELNLTKAKDTVTIASSPASAATEGARAAAAATLVEAQEAAATAAEPINTPINICFASNGTDILNHAVDIQMEHAPRDDMLKDDLRLCDPGDKVHVYDRQQLNTEEMWRACTLEKLQADPAMWRLLSEDGDVLDGAAPRCESQISFQSRCFLTPPLMMQMQPGFEPLVYQDMWVGRRVNVCGDPREKRMARLARSFGFAGRKALLYLAVSTLRVLIMMLR